MSQPATLAPAARTAFSWPMPPYFRLESEPAGGHSRECTVECIDGTAIEGELIHFHPEHGFIRLRVTGGSHVRKIPVGEVRRVCLASPFHLVRNLGLIRSLGAPHTDVADELAFRLVTATGATLEGRTRGFVRQPCGLYLFLLDAASAGCTGCFVPAAQVRDFQVGPRLGDALAHGSEPVGHKVLAQALEKQAKLRSERLGDYLASRAIVSAPDLARAIENQSRTPSVRLGELLVTEKLITRDQLEEALEVQRRNRERRLGDILVEMGIVTVRTIQKALSEKLGIPYVDVRRFAIDPATLRLLPPNVVHRDQVLPLLLVDPILVVAVENPLSGSALDQARFVADYTLIPVIADPADLRARIALEYPSGPADVRPGASARARQEVHDSTETEVLAQRLERETGPGERAPEEEQRVSDNTLVRLVNKIIVDAHAQGASDIHIETNAGKILTRVRLRKDGDLHDYLELQSAYRGALVSRIKIMAGLDISEHRHAQDGKINFARFGPLPIELRVAVVPTADGLEDVVMRLLGGVEPLPVDKLGLADADRRALEAMVQRSYGLILVCGPTGSGKTTTLHSLLHHINRPDLKIWTAEDPVEISQPGLRQVQINARIGWTFADAMRAFLRADPDVIMVGEMRDEETTKIAIEASLTGHLVFSTLHTNSAAESVVRLLDMGMDPFNFADALIGVLSQRLARRLCPQCRKPHAASDAELVDLAREYCSGTKDDPGRVIEQWRSVHAGEDGVRLYEASGCEKCTGGYRGRVGLYELLRASPQLKALVTAHAGVPQLAEAAREAGMKMLRQDAIDKVLLGLIDLPSARAASS